MTASETKEHTYLYQAINLINAPSIQHAMRIVDGEFTRPSPEPEPIINAHTATRDQGLEYLKTQFPPVDDSKRMSMGDVFTTANWIFRDKLATPSLQTVFILQNAPLLISSYLQRAKDSNQTRLPHHRL